jgi:hypothetical protein
MAYMTFKEQLSSHSTFLQQYEVQVEEIRVGQGFARCRAAGEHKGRGELCYCTKASRLRNGMLGLATWVRGEGGVVGCHKTYGLPHPFFFGLSYSSSSEGSCDSNEVIRWKTEAESTKKAEAFWRQSSSCGSSDYLQRKGVGSHGVRFRHNRYGRVAVVPLRDERGILWNCQLLNADGTKRFLRDSRTRGLFHKLHNLKDGPPIGLCESYVTAATCQELLGIPQVTAFNCQNLIAVSLLLQQYFPRSPLVIFADNDCHLTENKGVEAARRACAAGNGRVVMIAPEFGELSVDHDHTDWNDLVREIGCEATRKMMLEMIEHTGVL